MKRFLFYFVSTVVMGFIFYLGVKYQVRLHEELRNSFNLLPFLIFATIFPIAIGLLLRLPKLIIEIKEKKQWSFDWIKVAAIGIPSLYIAMIPILSLSTSFENLLFAKELIFLGDTTLTTTAGIVSGYVLFDSLKK
ncbi:hypothetical protein CKF48_09505 [Cytobacillus kochii]|uniref:Uncharacterized protein n=1 Tax=Cytobacillus kochii TaxID=859143 RepID=A0A248THD7_9BACI|nr:hypothetical protein CKF48_09505 [Cytobacillus kochii]